MPSKQELVLMAMLLLEEDDNDNNNTNVLGVKHALLERNSRKELLLDLATNNY